MYHPRTNDIHHPTLRFMHKWLGFTLFPIPDIRSVRIDDLKLLYALVKRRKLSPIKFMMRHWLEVFSLMGDVECTSLVTQIAQNLGLMDNASLSYIDTECWYVDFKYFRQALLLKKRNNGQLVMMYLRYTN